MKRTWCAAIYWEEKQKMKAFVAGTLAAVIIAVGAAFALDSLGLSSEAVYSTDSVRLGE